MATALKEGMRRAIPYGGAEMGQRSPRVAGAANSLPAPSAGSMAISGKFSLAPLDASDPSHWRPSFGVQGQDVSSYQGNVDWAGQWAMGSRFAYVKASEGNYYLNENFADQYNGSRGVGMIRGAYHFAIPNWSSGADQARYFVGNGGSWTPDGYTMPPVLDIEYNPYAGRTINGFPFGNTCYDMSPDQMSAWIADFGNTVKSLIGRFPVIYSTTDWWTRCTGNSQGFGAYPLWIASYPSSPTSSPGALPASWGQYNIWQYSSTGPFQGDSNVWNGSYAALATFAGTTPQGAFDSLAVERTGTAVSLRIRGWAADTGFPQNTTEVHAYVTAPNGTQSLQKIPATGYRPDVDQVLGLGTNHGFDTNLAINVSGSYKVCVYAIGKFTNVLLGCKSVTAVGAEPPLGYLDEAREVRAPNAESIRVDGWAVDMNNPAGTAEAHVYLYGPDGASTLYKLQANGYRPDVDQVLSVGPNHGFQSDIAITKAGAYRVCVYAVGQYLHALLGCRSISIAPAGSPIGTLDSLAVMKTSTQAWINARGWALDPGDATAQIPVHIYVQSPDGTRKLQEFTANTPRPDVNQVLRVPGDHGYEAAIPISEPGVHQVCAYGIALSPVSTGNTLLGCKSIDAGFASRPIGYLDYARISVASGQATISVAGWTLDPDIPAESIPAHVYVTFPDGTQKYFPLVADRPRPDVNTALKTPGNHGYTLSTAISQHGTYRVCAHGIGTSPFTLGNTLLGCMNVTY